MNQFTLDFLESTALVAARAGFRKFLGFSPMLAEISRFYCGPAYRRCDFVFQSKYRYTVVAIIYTRELADQERPTRGELTVFPPRWRKDGMLRLAAFKIRWIGGIPAFKFGPFIPLSSRGVAYSELPYNLRSEKA